MSHWRQLLCIVIFFSGISSQNQATGQKAQSLSPDKPPIQVFLTASGKDGSPTTPAQPEISVSVDKQPAHVNALRSAKSDKLLFAVLVDISQSNAANAGLIRNAAMQLFQSLSIQGNQDYLVLFSELVTISKEPLQVAQVQMALDAAKFEGGTTLYDAIEQTCMQKLSRAGNPDVSRRAILLISDGEDNASHIPHTMAEAAAEKEGVPIFSLVTRISHARPPGGLRGEQFLKEASHNTGGREITDKDLTEGVTHLLTAIEEQWALTFVPVQSPDHKLHSLAIKSLQKDVQISAPGHIFLQ